jgi:hypothetical protein
MAIPTTRQPLLYDTHRVDPKPIRPRSQFDEFLEQAKRLQELVNVLATAENGPRATALLHYFNDELQESMLKLFDFPDATAADVLLAAEFECDPLDLPRW